MNNEEKILEMLTQMQEEQKQMRGDLTEVKADLADVKAGLTDANVRLGIVETRLSKVENRLCAVETTQAKMQDEIHLTNVRIDMDVCERLGALVEGQDMTEERLDKMGGTLDEVKKLTEETSDKVDVIHAVVTQHSKAITELKKA